MHKAGPGQWCHPHPNHNKRWLVSAIAFLVFGALCGPVFADEAVIEVAHAVPDQPSLDLVAKLEHLQGLLQAPDAVVQSNAALIEVAGLSALVRSAEFNGFSDASDRAVSFEPVELTRFNMRLALTPLSQAFGADDNASIIAAQTTPDGTALVINAGAARLGDLRAAAGASATGPLILRQPLVIMAGASLSLATGDVLELSRPDGAFLVNFGHLDMRGGTIAGTGDANPLARTFAPFVTTIEAGTLNIQGGHFSGLGFGDTLKFSGFSVMRSVLQVPDRPSHIENAEFDGIISVTVSGDTDLLLRGNRFHDMRGPSLTLSRIKGARVISNLFYGEMPTNAIRLENGSAEGLIAGNIVLGGERVGIVVRGDSPGVTVSHNIVWSRDGGGIALVSADCGRVYENLVIGNAQKGIEVRSSIAAELRLNTVYSNDSAGIWVSDQADGTQTRLTGNIVAFNGAGLAGADTALILMDANDFSQQYQQFLSGDLAQLTADIARDMTGAAPFVLASGGQATILPDVSTNEGTCSD
jgi:mannuronan 5-epimerase